MTTSEQVLTVEVPEDGDPVPVRRVELANLEPHRRGRGRPNSHVTKGHLEVPAMVTAILVCTLAAVDPPLKLEKADTAGTRSYPVIHVPDGNSIVLKVGTHTARVRLLGVEAPADFAGREYHYAAIRFLKGFLRDQSVYLRYEDAAPGNDPPLSLGKQPPITPAYVYRASDGLFVNLEAISQGYGRVSTGVAFKLREPLRAEERTARAERIGLWDPVVRERAQEGYAKIAAENRHYKEQEAERDRQRMRERAARLADFLQARKAAMSRCKKCGTSPERLISGMCKSCEYQDFMSSQK